jgi:hypothetical protein
MNIFFDDDTFYKDPHYNLFKDSFFQSTVQRANKMHQLMNDIFQHELKDEPSTINKSPAETKEKDPEENKSYYYSSTTASYSDGTGLTHTKRKVRDNVHGTQFTETRKIGDKSITRNRETDLQGKVEETETRYNITAEDEIEAFEKEWENRRKINQGICFNEEIPPAISSEIPKLQR